jgi:hypothetical protein
MVIIGKFFIFNFLDIQMGTVGMAVGHHLINRCGAYSVGRRHSPDEQRERNRLV